MEINNFMQLQENEFHRQISTDFIHEIEAISHATTEVKAFIVRWPLIIVAIVECQNELLNILSARSRC